MPRWPATVPMIGMRDIRTIPVFIYGICDPDGTIRYVGKSQKPHARLSSHWSRSGARRVREWLQGLRAAGACAFVVILERVEPGSDAGKAELEWVRRLRASGSPLLNFPYNRESWAA